MFADLRSAVMVLARSWLSGASSRRSASTMCGLSVVQLQAYHEPLSIVCRTVGLLTAECCVCVGSCGAGVQLYDPPVTDFTGYPCTATRDQILDAD